MKVGEAGECFFVIQSSDPVPEEYATSPLIQSQKPPKEIIANLSTLTLGDRKVPEISKYPNKITYPLSDSEVDYINSNMLLNRPVVSSLDQLSFLNREKLKYESATVKPFDDYHHHSLSDSELYSYDLSGGEPQKSSSIVDDNIIKNTSGKESSSFWSWGWGKLPKQKQSTIDEKSSKTLPSTPERKNSTFTNQIFSPPLPLQSPSPTVNRSFHSDSNELISSPSVENATSSLLDPRSILTIDGFSKESSNINPLSHISTEPFSFHPSFPTENPSPKGFTPFSLESPHIKAIDPLDDTSINYPQTLEQCPPQIIQVTDFSESLIKARNDSIHQISSHSDNESTILNQTSIESSNSLVELEQYSTQLISSETVKIQPSHSFPSIPLSSPLVSATQNITSNQEFKEVSQLSESGKQVSNSVGWQFWWRKNGIPNSSPPSPVSSFEALSDAIKKEPPSKSFYYKSLRLSSEQLSVLNLKRGSNTITFTTSRGASCSSRIFYWPHDSKIIISDVDGTITKSDVLGHLYTMVGKDWTHSGVARLYSSIKSNGYEILYLTSRAIGQVGSVVFPYFNIRLIILEFI